MVTTKPVVRGLLPPVCIWSFGHLRVLSLPTLLGAAALAVSDEASESRPGRNSNPTYPLRAVKDSDLHETHVIRLRSKFSLQKLYPSPPKHPPAPATSKGTGSSPGAPWLRKAHEFARYVLVLHRPLDWDDDDEPAHPEGLNWVNLCRYLERLRRPDATLIDRTRLLWIEILAAGISPHAQDKRAVMSFRNRCVEK